HEVWLTRGGPGLAVGALSPLRFGVLCVKILVLGRRVFGDRVGGFATRPALQGLRRAERNEFLGQSPASTIGPLSIDETGNSALQETLLGIFNNAIHGVITR